jgi:preprotein translocase subunit SecF
MMSDTVNNDMYDKIQKAAEITGTADSLERRDNQAKILKEAEEMRDNIKAKYKKIVDALRKGENTMNAIFDIFEVTYEALKNWGWPGYLFFSILMFITVLFFIIPFLSGAIKAYFFDYIAIVFAIAIIWIISYCKRKII